MAESLNLCSTRITKNLTRRNKFESNPTQIEERGRCTRPYRNQAEGAEGGAGGRGATSHAATGSSPPSGGGGGSSPHNPDDSPEFPNRRKNQASPMAGNRGTRPQRTSSRCEAANPARRGPVGVYRRLCRRLCLTVTGGARPHEEEEETD